MDQRVSADDQRADLEAVNPDDERSAFLSAAVTLQGECGAGRLYNTRYFNRRAQPAVVLRQDPEN
jgi:hypothetical protein